MESQSIHPTIQIPLVPYGNLVKGETVNDYTTWWVQASKDPKNPKYIRVADLLIDVLKDQFEDQDFARVLLKTKEEDRWEYMEGYFHFGDTIFPDDRWKEE